jgi:2-dehydropantoate 2-reductase
MDHHVIGVLGGGAMGSLFAGRLALAGTPVILIARPSSHVDALVTHGLTLIEAGQPSTQIPLTVTIDPDAAADLDMLIVQVKTWATHDAVAPLARALPSTATVITLQNGIGNREALARSLPDHPVARITAGVTSEAALITEAGVVHHTGHGRTEIGVPVDGEDRALERLCRVLSRAGLPAFRSTSIEPAIWRKLAINAAINGLTALSGQPNGAVAHDPGLRAAASIIGTEVAGVARAAGIDLVDVVADILAVADASATNRSSMLQDLESGRRTEVDAIHGAVVEIAAQHGISVPVCETLASLIRAREWAYGAG